MKTEVKNSLNTVTFNFIEQGTCQLLFSYIVVIIPVAAMVQIIGHFWVIQRFLNNIYTFFAYVIPNGEIVRILYLKKVTKSKCLQLCHD